MLTEERREKIFEILGQKSAVTVAELSRTFNHPAPESFKGSLAKEKIELLEVKED